MGARDVAAWEYTAMKKNTSCPCMVELCEREAGRAFGPVAEACRKELARRGEQA